MHVPRDAKFLSEEKKKLGHERMMMHPPYKLPVFSNFFFCLYHLFFFPYFENDENIKRSQDLLYAGHYWLILSR